MSLIIVTPDETKKKSQAKLQAAIDDPLTVSLIVYGTEAGIDAIVEIANARAQLRPMIRKVIWVKDPAVLTATQKKNYFKKDRAVVAIDLRDQICGSLELADASDPFEIELAFTAAESIAREEE